MRSLRQIHLYLGCFFAPMIIYFSLSGVWQVFRLNDLPQTHDREAAQEEQVTKMKESEEPPAAGFLRLLMHELSKPHTDSTLPGAEPSVKSSAIFNWMAAAMGIGLFSTTLLGIILALRFNRKPVRVWLCLGAGALLPVLALLFAAV